MLQLTFRVKANVPQPNHEILLVKHGERADNEIAFDEHQDGPLRADVAVS